MKFIALDRHAAEAMILQRELFSSEFEKGLSFLNILKGSSVSNFTINNVAIISIKDGIYLIGKNETRNSIFELLVIDSEASGLFCDRLSDQENIQILQKLIRFSIRYWNKQGFPQSEKILTESAKAVLFPFSFSTSSNFKLVIERDADSKRTHKRNFGRNLLLYKANSETAPSYVEQPSLANFRIACDGFAKAFADAHSMFESSTPCAADISTEEAISVYTLDQISKQSPPPNSFDYWMARLSVPQLKIINSSLKRPVRIQGAAGTGKTLALILKAISEYRKAVFKKEDFKAIFLTHSNATRDTIKYYIETINGSNEIFDDKKQQSIKISTLYSHFLDMLQSDISSSDVLENDAYDAKIMQELYVSECLEKHSKSIIKTGGDNFSKDFIKFINSLEAPVVSTMLMHEFSVQLKGKSSGDFEKYKLLPPLPSGVPAQNTYDKMFVFRIYTEYQKIFDSLGQFDADDIALSAHSKLNTPIWKRRRLSDGYDCIFLDETHLFNLNELQTIHFLTKNEKVLPIIFAIDTAQAIGELACDGDALAQYFCGTGEIEGEQMKTVFRSTHEVANLAAAILTSGAQVFTNLTSLYSDASFSANYFDPSVDGIIPQYFLKNSDKEIIEHTISLISEFLKTGIPASDICIIIFADDIKNNFFESLDSKRFKYTTIMRRGDFLETRNAKEHNKIIVSFPEYVGGLEFDTVILLGVDAGRVPQAQSDISEHFFKYTATTKLYISVSRAKRNVVILGDQNRGTSPCLEYSIANNFIQKI